MGIHLTPEQQQIVQDELRSGHFRSAEEVIGEALRTLRERRQAGDAGEANGAQQAAVREMISFVEKNHVRLQGLSVKDLIHEGHRL
jgi:Arc/MetJ-type ribon-helix-helix transcriptional regulator